MAFGGEDTAIQYVVGHDAFQVILPVPVHRDNSRHRFYMFLTKGTATEIAGVMGCMFTMPAVHI